MNGCDRADQLVKYYGVHKRKSVKWWKKSFHFLIEIIHVNAKILFSHCHMTIPAVPPGQPPTDPRPEVVSLRNFKLKLIEQLVAASLTNTIIPPPPAPAPLADITQTDSPNVRIAPDSHFQESAGPGKDRLCKVCNGKDMPRKRTRNIVCPGKPHLCPGNCFQSWHKKT